MKLTAQTIKGLALPPGKADKIFFDDEVRGFGIRLRASGEARWLVQYDDDVGRTRKVTLGSPALLDASAARSAARDLLARIRLGADPSAERAQRKERASVTFAASLPRYLSHQRAARRARSFTELERHLMRHAKPLHGKQLATRDDDASLRRSGVLLDQRCIASLIGQLAARAPKLAVDCRTSIIAYCGWLTREGLLEANPALATNVPTSNGPRKRLITGDELRGIWAALPEPGHDFGDLVRLLVYTLARRSELGDLLWSEVNLADGTIELPAARMKGNRPHTIVLSDPAIAILAARPRDGREHVFGGKRGFANWTHHKAALDKRLPADMPGWVLHDFRRFSTTLHEVLGVQPHIVESILAHVGHQSGVAGTYNLAVYLPERRRALEKWAPNPSDLAVFLRVDQVAAAVQATAMKAKLFGFMVDRQQVQVEHTLRKPSADENAPAEMSLEDWQAKYAGGPGLSDGRNGKLIEHEH